MSWLWVLVFLALCFGTGAWLGAPYLPVLRREVETLVNLGDIKPGMRVLDLGSGDGRLLKAAVQRGAVAIGYEVNPILVAWSRIATWRQRRSVRIYWQDYWRADWPSADVIFVFLIGRYMDKLGQEFEHRLDQPTKVISYGFQIPGKQAVASTKNSYVYIYGNWQSGQSQAASSGRKMRSR